jgi:hypothetical protein
MVLRAGVEVCRGGAAKAYVVLRRGATTTAES